MSVTYARVKALTGKKGVVKTKITQIAQLDLEPAAPLGEDWLATLMRPQVTLHHLLKGEAIFEYAESLKVLKNSDSAEDLTRAITAVESASSMLPEDPDLSEIREVLATFE